MLTDALSKLKPMMYCQLRTVKTREFVFYRQQPYQPVSANCMLVNIISCMCVPYLPYTLYSEGQVIGGVNKEAVALNNPTKEGLEHPHLHEFAKKT